jgi:hypothetical protein
MTDRNPDYHCATCRAYMFSTFAHEPASEGPHYCDDCKAQPGKGAPVTEIPSFQPVPQRSPTHFVFSNAGRDGAATVDPGYARRDVARFLIGSRRYGHVVKRIAPSEFRVATDETRPVVVSIKPA